MPLNQVAAAEGRLIVSTADGPSYPQLFVINAENGQIAWEKDFEDIDFLNQPAYADNTVYIQTCNIGYDTFLRAYHVTTGDLLFESHHGNQRSKYLSPTVYDGNVYINGGTYGGVYGFDGITGEQQWFFDLNDNYYGWTPAVNEEYVIAYTGARLTVINRQTGVEEFNIQDPGFHSAYCMRLAPVIGSHDDVIVVNFGRLISFDLVNRIIDWEIESDFSGQPSVADGKIYSISNGALCARDEQNGSLLWVWAPPNGNLVSNILVTDSHIFASTDTETFAIDLDLKTHIWSYPAGGNLSLTKEGLYIATKSGTLIAIRLSTGDLDNDGDVDGADLSKFAADFDRTNCMGDCPGDFDVDGDADESDLANFASVFGH